MTLDLEMLSKHLKEEIGDLTTVAFIFGSSISNSDKESRDIDIFAVGKDEPAAEKINSESEKLSERMKLHLDLVSFSADDVKNRYEYNDYLLGSMLEDVRYLFGDREFLTTLREGTLSKKPTDMSVKYNMLQSLYVFDICLLHFEEFKFYSRKIFHDSFPDIGTYKEFVFKDAFSRYVTGKPNDIKGSQQCLFETLRNIPVSLGYHLASQKIKGFGRTVSLRDLKGLNETKEEKFFNEVYSYYKNCKKSDIDSAKVQNYLDTLAAILKSYQI